MSEGEDDNKVLPFRRFVTEDGEDAVPFRLRGNDVVGNTEVKIEAMLESAKKNCVEGIFVGIDKDNGKLWVASTYSSMKDAAWMLDRAKIMLLDTVMTLDARLPGGQAEVASLKEGDDDAGED